MRLQPGLGPEENFGPQQDAPQEVAPAQPESSEPSVTTEVSAHDLMVTHVSVPIVFEARGLCAV